MYVQVVNGEIEFGPQSSKGHGDNWYRYEGVNPIDAGPSQILTVSVSGDVATGSFVTDPNASDFDEDYNRSIRLRLLRDSDWTQLPDSPLTDAKKTEWAVYRQQLRDLPMTSNPDDVAWPTAP